jgi:hypothetical protein
MFQKGEAEMNQIKNQLEAAGYDYAVAIATQAEIQNGAACGQLSIITQKKGH